VTKLMVGKSLARFPQVLAKHAPAHSQVMVVADSAVASLLGKSLQAGLVRAGFAAQLTVIPSGERSKTLLEAARLYRTLSRARFDRRSLLVALGGGVVGDLTGFVAATYLRGIPYVQVPTTLLAQVDAAIGGKTGVDIPEGKNLVGAFYPPLFTWIDPTLLKTLPERHWRNGLAEVIKYGAIWDEDLFEKLERSMDQLLKGYSAAWDPIIARCAAIKSEVVRKDPLEKAGFRAILNFGHSVGHAIEAAAGYRDYLHGEAISIGMFVSGMLSEELAGLDPLDRIRLGTLLTKAGLPARVRKPISRKRLMEYLARDKKAQEGTVRFVLLKGLGKAVSGQSVPSEILDTALIASGL
jgi:3-dehydroquinate synthase